KSSPPGARNGRSAAVAGPWKRDPAPPRVAQPRARFYNTAVPHSGLEQSLRKLSEIGRIVKDRPYRQVWRFEHEGRPYYLKFYPKPSWLGRVGRGSRAMAEFVRLQMLQKANVPAPRASAVLL